MNISEGKYTKNSIDLLKQIFHREASIYKTQLSNKTIADWLSFLREVIMISLDDKFEEQGQIGGEGII